MNFFAAFRVFVNSLWIQASWSFEGMQSLGFANAISPALDDDEKLKDHAEFFNTHPIMASAVLGAVARLEAEGEHQKALELKRMVMGPFGGMGDAFYWGGVKVFLSVSAVLMVVAGYPVAAFGFVALWTLVNVLSRAFLFWFGFKGREQALLRIASSGLAGYGARMKTASAVLLGLSLGLYSAMASGSYSLPLALAATAFGASFLVRRVRDPVWLVYVGALISIGIGMVL